MNILPRHRRFVVIGNPRSRRIAGFQRALVSQGYPPARVVAYADFIAGRAEIARHLDSQCVLRIESPGEDWEVEKLLLKEGVEGMEAEGRQPWSASQIYRLEFQRGAIFRPRQWYLGFVRVLQRLQRDVASSSEPHYMAHPDDIPVLFDKARCQSQFQASGIPVPAHWTGIETYEQLRDRFVPHPHRRLFAKIANGYSAVGAVALEWRGSRARALSPVEMVQAEDGPRLFLSKHIQSYTDERDIAALIDALGRESLLIEEWLPKARIDSMSFDLRVVTIAGRACHVVGRANPGPFTNLNLGSQRIDAAKVRCELGDSWPTAMAICEQVALLFPNSLYLGVDLLVRPDKRRFAVLEANAFGDLLPGLLHDGRETYEMEILALTKRPEHALC
ncbi:MAG: STM4014 family protein [Planctomycetia bacterium]|nr:STM4014 family protein [Planctomycetia bacterium]